MKLSYIIGLIIIAVAVGVIISATGDASTYVTLTEAKSLSKEGDDSEVHVVGKVKKDGYGKIVGMEYLPTVDPNYFAFTLVDTNRVEMKVILNKPKPADFERSEQIVIKGHVAGEQFIAKDVLLKCPSKYTEKEISETSMR